MTAVKLYQSLITFLEQMRETFDELEKMAHGYVDNHQFKEVDSRIRKRKRFFDENYTLALETDSK